jgi:hypothetical protein
LKEREREREREKSTVINELHITHGSTVGIDAHS